MNSDAFVTKGWLEEMMGGFHDDVAAVSPTTNNCQTEQSQGEQFALDHQQKYKEIRFLSGFCIIIRKGITEFPKEVPFYGNENSWEIEAKRKGYRVLWSMGAYVEHIGGASAKGTNLRSKGLNQFALWLAKTTPVLFTTYNRLDYTKKSLKALRASNCGQIIVIDNNSTDGTQKWLKKQKGINLILNKENRKVAGAMNQFFDLTKNEEYISKVDNDTIVPKDWLVNMIRKSLITEVDIIQAKHPLLKETCADGFDKWVENFPLKRGLRISNFVGGSGTIIRRIVIKERLKENLGPLSGWVDWQHEHPEAIKAFDTQTEIKLLDTAYGGVKKYGKYLNYYQETGRL